VGVATPKLSPGRIMTEVGTHRRGAQLGGVIPGVEAGRGVTAPTPAGVEVAQTPGRVPPTAYAGVTAVASRWVVEARAAPVGAARLAHSAAAAVMLLGVSFMPQVRTSPPTTARASPCVWRNTHDWVGTAVAAEPAVAPSAWVTAAVHPVGFNKPAAKNRVELASPLAGTVVGVVTRRARGATPLAVAEAQVPREASREVGAVCSRFAPLTGA